MNTVSVQVPFTLTMQFEPFAKSIPDNMLDEWNEWRSELYQDSNGKCASVRYYTLDILLPDEYGFCYTRWIVTTSLDAIKNSIS